MKRLSGRSKKALALAVLACFGTCAFLRSQRPAVSEALAPPPPGPSAAVLALGAAASTRIAPKTSASAVAPVAPIIDAVTLEKTEVCEGEENLVTVQAHTEDGHDAFLHFQVGPGSGSPAALRSYLDPSGRPTSHRVTAFGKNNVATSVDVPTFRVVRCDPAFVAVVERRLLPNTLAEFDFSVILAKSGTKETEDAAGLSFRPRSFRWSFGDGTPAEESREPHARHDFGARPQDTLYSQFLVTVEVIGEDERRIKARHSLELLNPAFEAFAYKGVVQLFSELTPRFPVLSESGVVDQGIRIWHTRAEPVEITKVTVIRQYVDGVGRSPPETLSPASVVGATRIPEGRGLSLRVLLDSRLEPDTLSRDYLLEGRTREGHPARGAFSVMVPPPRPTKERHDPIADPTLIAKIKIAREVLRREYVTDEDLATLDRAGRFANLRVDPVPVAPPAASRPPPRVTGGR